MLLTLLAAAVIITVIALRLDDGDRSTPPDGGFELPTRTFATWDEFLQSPERKDKSGGKVVFIGIDGAAWNIIDPMIDAGVLPTLERLKREGSYGTLRSVECYVSPPAWTTMMTGFRPEKTGIYTFGRWDSAEHTFRPLSSEDVRVPSVWDISSHAGRRTAVTNMPVTYPVRELNGIMVSGLMSPVTLDDRRTADLFLQPAGRDVAGLPASLVPLMTASLEHAENRLEFLLGDVSDDGMSLYDRVWLKVHPRDGTSDTAPTYEFDVWGHSPWVELSVRDDEGTLRKGRCRIRVLPTGKTKYSYVLWFSLTLSSVGDIDAPVVWPASLIDDLEEKFEYYFPSQFLDREMVPDFTRDAASFAEFFRDYDDWDLFLYVFTQTDNIQHIDGDSPLTKSVYRTIDDFLGRLVEDLPDNTTLVIASDHGFKKYSITLDLNELFERMGLLKFGDDGQIDFEHTLVFHNLWCIYFNRDLLDEAELQRRGIEVRGSMTPEDALARHVEQAGRAIGASGEQRFPVEFTRVSARPSSDAPDLIVKGTYENYIVEFWNIQRPQGAVLRPLGAGEQWNHTREGIYIVYGKGVRRAFEGPVHDIEDMGPTMLYLLDLPGSAQMDGRVMTSVFDDDLLAEKTLYVVQNYREVPRQTIAGEKKRESLEQKLRSLGYIR